MDPLKPTNKQWPQYMVAMIACLGNLSIGNVFGWMSPAHIMLESGNNTIGVLSKAEIDWAVSTLMISASLTPVLVTYLVDNLGRKWTLFLASITIAFGWLFILFGTTTTMLYVARAILGLGFGLTCGTVPLYIGEISEPHIRGRLVTINTIFFGLGVIMASVGGPLLTYQMLTAVCMVSPLVLGFTLIIFAPESPIFLAKKEKIEELERSLMFLRGHTDPSNVQKELKEMTTYINERNSVSFKEAIAELKLKKTQMAFFLIVMLSFSAHMSGYEPTLSYTEYVFRILDSSIEPSQAVIIFSCIAVIFSTCSCYMFDKINRRTIYTICCLIASVSLAVIGGSIQVFKHFPHIDERFSWIPVSALFIFRAAFDVGIYPVQIVVANEIFSPTFVGLANSINSFLTTVIALTCCVIFQIAGPAFGYDIVFYIYSICLFVGFLVVVKFLPETRGKTLSEIHDDMDKKFSRSG